MEDCVLWGQIKQRMCHIVALPITILKNYLNTKEEL
jgi:hypothetical protein